MWLACSTHGLNAHLLQKAPPRPLRILEAVPDSFSAVPIPGCSWRYNKTFPTDKMNKSVSKLESHIEELQRRREAAVCIYEPLMRSLADMEAQYSHPETQMHTASEIEHVKNGIRASHEARSDVHLYISYHDFMIAEARKRIQQIWNGDKVADGDPPTWIPPWSVPIEHLSPYIFESARDSGHAIDARYIKLNAMMEKSAKPEVEIETAGTTGEDSLAPSREVWRSISNGNTNSLRALGHSGAGIEMDSWLKQYWLQGGPSAPSDSEQAVMGSHSHTYSRDPESATENTAKTVLELDRHINELRQRREVAAREYTRVHGWLAENEAAFRRAEEDDEFPQIPANLLLI